MQCLPSSSAYAVRAKSRALPSLSVFAQVQLIVDGLPGSIQACPLVLPDSAESARGAVPGLLPARSPDRPPNPPCQLSAGVGQRPRFCAWLPLILDGAASVDPLHALEAFAPYLLAQRCLPGP